MVSDEHTVCVTEVIFTIASRVALCGLYHLGVILGTISPRSSKSAFG